MERTVSLVVYTLIALIAAGLLIMYVQRSLIGVQSPPINLTDDRGMFAVPPCDESACEMSDAVLRDCVRPACVSNSCAQGAKNRTVGWSCLLANGSAGACDGNGACAQTSCAATGTCQTCAPDDATYMVSRNITDTNAYPETYNGDSAHSFGLLGLATVRLGAERYLVYGWWNSVGIFNITTPLQDTWTPLPNDGHDFNPQTQPLTIPTQFAAEHNPPGFVWIVNSSFRGCAFDAMNHAFIVNHIGSGSFATLDDFPYVYVNRDMNEDGNGIGAWGWDLLDIRPPVHFLHAGDDPVCRYITPEDPEITSRAAGGPGILFRNSGSVYLARGNATYLLSAADGSITPENFKEKSTETTTETYTVTMPDGTEKTVTMTRRRLRPYGNLPVTIPNSPLVHDAVYERGDQQFLLLGNGPDYYTVSSITLINVTQPSSPTLVATWTLATGNLPAQGFVVDAQRNVLYTISRDGLTVYAFNLSNLLAPSLLSTTRWETFTFGTVYSFPRLSITGDLLVASESNRTGFFNIKDPLHPALLRGQQGITNLTQRPRCRSQIVDPYGMCTNTGDANGHESPGCDILAFQQDGGYYTACGRVNEGYIVKVESCTLSATVT